MRTDGTWDVRCPAVLKTMFPPEARRGYWYKVNTAQAVIICEALSREYGVAVPRVQVEIAFLAARKINAGYLPKRHGGTILLYSRNHMKSVFHEWYHHLDHATGGAYNSSDFGLRGKAALGTGHEGNQSLAWQFAERMWAALRDKPV